MANDSDSVLIISGPHTKVREFRANAEVLDNDSGRQVRLLCFEKTVPVASIRDHGPDDFVWPEPWEVKRHEKDGVLIYDFTWIAMPPWAWVKWVSERWPELIFELRYALMDSLESGYMFVSNGQIIFDQTNELIGQVQHQSGWKVDRSYRKDGTKLLEAVKWGQDDSWANLHDGPCGDCGVKLGGYHDLGCDIESCPFCGGQLITCGCLELPLMEMANLDIDLASEGMCGKREMWRPPS